MVDKNNWKRSQKVDQNWNNVSYAARIKTVSYTDCEGWKVSYLIHSPLGTHFSSNAEEYVYIMKHMLGAF